MRKHCKMILLACLTFLLMGCGVKNQGEGYDIFYLNNELTCIQEERHNPSEKSENPAEMADIILKIMATEPETTGLRRTLTDELSTPVITMSGEQITLNFPEVYNAYSASEEVLVRAAVVRTLSQIPGISCVRFQVGGEPLLTRNSREVIGVMYAEDFVENTGEQINKSMEENITLYFANEEGNGLVRRYRKVRYTSNESLEKTVVRQLLKGPTDSALQGTIPHSANIISVTVVDKVCYVNLDDNFRNEQNPGITEAVVLYSIVNSLTELPTVDMVQISVNGDSSGKVRYNLDLDTMYTGDASLVVEEEIPSSSEGEDGGENNQ